MWFVVSVRTCQKPEIHRQKPAHLGFEVKSSAVPEVKNTSSFVSFSCQVFRGIPIDLEVPEGTQLMCLAESTHQSIVLLCVDTSMLGIYKDGPKVESWGYTVRHRGQSAHLKSPNAPCVHSPSYAFGVGYRSATLNTIWRFPKWKKDP